MSVKFLNIDLFEDRRIGELNLFHIQKHASVFLFVDLILSPNHVSFFVLRLEVVTKRRNRVLEAQFIPDGLENFWVREESIPFVKDFVHVPNRFPKNKLIDETFIDCKLV
jgi:hypothetical protein